MDSELFQREKALATAVEEACAFGYRPTIAVVGPIDAALGGGTAELVVSGLQPSDSGDGAVHGTVLVASATHMAIVELDESQSVRSGPMTEKAFSVQVVPRAALEALQLSVPERPISYRDEEDGVEGLPGGSAVTLIYRGVSAPVVLDLRYNRHRGYATVRTLSHDLDR